VPRPPERKRAAGHRDGGGEEGDGGGRRHGGETGGGPGLEAGAGGSGEEAATCAAVDSGTRHPTGTRAVNCGIRRLVYIVLPMHPFPNAVRNVFPLRIYLFLDQMLRIYFARLRICIESRFKFDGNFFYVYTTVFMFKNAYKANNLHNILKRESTERHFVFSRVSSVTTFF